MDRIVDLTLRSINPNLIDISTRLLNVQLCAACFAEERSHSVKHWLRLGDLPSANLFFLASVKEVLSSGAVVLGTGIPKAMHLIRPLVARPLLLEEKDKGASRVFLK